MRLTTQKHVVVEQEDCHPITHICLHTVNPMQQDVRVRRNALALVEAGFRVTCIDLEGVSTREDDVELTGVTLIHIPASHTFQHKRFTQWALLRAVLLFVQSVYVLLRIPADVYHAQDMAALPACYAAACLRRKKVVFESYELPFETQPLSKMSRSRRILQILLKPLFRYLIPRCDGVLAVSPPIVQEMNRLYHCTNTVLLRNILPFQKVAPGKRFHQLLELVPTVRIALYQGNIQSDRCLEQLVYAAKYLPDDVVIVLMGKGSDEIRMQLTALIEAEKVTERIKLISAVPYTELLYWTASADIGLLLYTPKYSLNVKMMLPNKLFEFLMAGLPILTARLDAVVELVETHHLGRVQDVLSPHEIADAICELLHDTDTLECMRTNALSLAKCELNWEKEQWQLIKLYQRIVSFPKAL